MKICAVNQINFQRRLKPSEEAEYRSVLNEAQNKGKKILIVPATSLPSQTGVGNLSSKESLEFFDFAQKYWGINEIQILPMGQYHIHNNEVPFYSGTSMDLGNHVINLEYYTTEKPISQITDKVDFRNVITQDSSQEKILKKLYQEKKFQKEFENFKNENHTRLEPKALYRALRELNGTHDYKQWAEADKKLFELPQKEREKRISEIKNLKNEIIDFYYFKQFLAEDSLKKAREELHKRGLKLNGDMLCGFSYDEVWANPKAFHPDTTIGWELPALNLDSPEGEKLLREKTKFYAQRYDGLRIDASSTYISQPNIKNGVEQRREYGDKILNIIDEEVKKVKGADFDIKNIMHEHLHNNSNRIGIHTSDHLSDNWGSNRSFLKKGWSPDSFIIGARNHDSAAMVITDKQRKALSEIYGEIKNDKEFMRAKLAEPMGAKHNMLFFMDALNIKGQFQNNSDRSLNYAIRIPENYQDKYFAALENGEGFNPMDALERNFRAQGLDKEDPKLFKKIVKYRKILEQKEKQTSPLIKIGIGLICSGLAIYGFLKYVKNKHYSTSI